jgi:hypothetical protein
MQSTCSGQTRLDRPQGPRSLRERTSDICIINNIYDKMSVRGANGDAGGTLMRAALGANGGAVGRRPRQPSVSPHEPAPGVVAAGGLRPEGTRARVSNGRSARIRAQRKHRRRDQRHLRGGLTGLRIGTIMKKVYPRLINLCMLLLLSIKLIHCPFVPARVNPRARFAANRRAAFGAVASRSRTSPGRVPATRRRRNEPVRARPREQGPSAKRTHS